MELNKVMIIGNLTRDPESRFTSNGAQVVKMGLASNRRSGGGGDNRREEVLYIDVEAWNRTAELCAQYLKKGSQILVEGRLKMDSWESQTGEKRNKILIVADRIQFGSKADNQGGDDGGQGYGGGGNRGGSGGYQGNQQGQNYSGGGRNVQESASGYSQGGGNQNSGGDSWSGGDETEDDLPF